MSDSKYAYPNVAQGTVVIGTDPKYACPNAAQGTVVIVSDDPKYADPYPAQAGYYEGPPVMPPPQYAGPPPRREPGFLEGCLAALRCCCLINECCSDPLTTFIG